jgi:multisubunit Na+/H+ antiporter MnhB subunit
MRKHEDSISVKVAELIGTVVIVFVGILPFWMFIYGYYSLSGSKNPLRDMLIDLLNIFQNINL